MVLAAVRENRFFGFTDPQVREPMISRATDWEGFIGRQVAEIESSAAYAAPASSGGRP
jgi:hypothetical protein